jgi:thymidylate synthase
MKVIQGRNVNENFHKVVDYLVAEGIREDSRNGPVYVSPTPVVLVYDKPSEKVLFSAVRDANPFFHLMEAMWMLNGAHDAKFLNHYVKDFGERYADNGVLHGAYGHRWRHTFGQDQVETVVRKLRHDHLDRQAMIQMWDPHVDKSNDLLINVKDRPCNSLVYFRVNQGVLDMSTTARSHDAIWGATGANAVHFVYLQEYVAGFLKIPMGKFYQYSWNFHMYESAYENLKKKGEIKISKGEDKYFEMAPLPLVSEPSTFEKEFQYLMEYIRFMQNTEIVLPLHEIKIPKDNHFLWETVWPVAKAHFMFKKSGIAAGIKECGPIQSVDWQLACIEWLKRREKKKT